MDMQRQAFEESNNITPDWSFKFDDELQQYVAIDFEMTSQVEEFNEHWDTFRAGWQAAKASAVPDEYKLVKKPKPLIGNDAVDFSQAPVWAKYWLMDLGGKCWWSNVRPSIDNDLGCFVFPHNNKAEQAPNFGFSGNFKKSMTSRKAMIEAAQEQGHASE